MLTSPRKPKASVNEVNRKTKSIGLCGSKEGEANILKCGEKPNVDHIPNAQCRMQLNSLLRLEAVINT